jgi:hypothetical protein
MAKDEASRRARQPCGIIFLPKMFLPAFFARAIGGENRKPSLPGEVPRGDFDGKKMKGKKMKQQGEHTRAGKDRQELVSTPLSPRNRLDGTRGTALRPWHPGGKALV